MGVWGLTTFVEKNQRKLYTREKLRNSSLVIDGFGLLYNLYFESGLDSRLGGEYAAFAEVIVKFFSQLKSCNVEPYVVLDGPIPSEKRDCVVKRLGSRVMDVRTMFRTGAKLKVLPLFAASILQRTLTDLEIPHAFTIEDADTHIASIANRLKCPVLSQDSDYYILSVDMGYLALSHFHWEETYKDKTDGSYIVCQKYHISNMTHEYGIDESAIWLIAVLLGNDWIPRDTFSQLLSHIPRKKSTQKQKKMKKKNSDDRIELLINWLSTRYKDDTSMIDKLRSTLPKDRRESVIKKVEGCLFRYKAPPGVGHMLDILKASKQQSQPNVTSQAKDKTDLYEGIRRGDISALFVEVKDTHCVCLPVIPSNPRKPSPHDCALEIRRLLYHAIIRNYSSGSSPCGSCHEYDKVGPSYKIARTVTFDTHVCPACDEKHVAVVACGTTEKEPTGCQVRNGSEATAVESCPSPGHDEEIKAGFDGIHGTTDDKTKTEKYSASHRLEVSGGKQTAVQASSHKNDNAAPSIITDALPSNVGTCAAAGIASTSLIVRIMKVDSNVLFPTILEDSHSVFAELGPAEAFECLAISLLCWVKTTSPKPVIIFSLITTIVLSILLRKELYKPSVTRPQDSEKDSEGVVISTLPAKHSSKPDCEPKDQKDERRSLEIGPLLAKRLKVDSEPNSVAIGAMNLKKHENVDRILDAISPPIVNACGVAGEEGGEEDLDLLHSTTEWQCVLYWVRMFCQSYGVKGYDVPVQRLLSSNQLLQRVHTRVRKMIHKEKCTTDMRSIHSSLTGRLGEFPRVLASVKILTDFLMQYVPG